MTSEGGGVVTKLLWESIPQESREKIDGTPLEEFARLLDTFVSECRPDVVSLVLTEASAALDARAELPHPDASPELWAAAISRLEDDPEWSPAPALAGYRVVARRAVLLERVRLRGSSKT